MLPSGQVGQKYHFVQRSQLRDKRRCWMIEPVLFTTESLWRQIWLGWRDLVTWLEPCAVMCCLQGLSSAAAERQNKHHPREMVTSHDRPARMIRNGENGRCDGVVWPQGGDIASLLRPVKGLEENITLLYTHTHTHTSSLVILDRRSFWTDIFPWKYKSATNQANAGLWTSHNPQRPLN